MAERPQGEKQEEEQQERQEEREEEGRRKTRSLRISQIKMASVHDAKRRMGARGCGDDTREAWGEPRTGEKRRDEGRMSLMDASRPCSQTRTSTGTRRD